MFFSPVTNYAKSAKFLFFNFVCETLLTETLFMSKTYVLQVDMDLPGGPWARSLIQVFRSVISI